MYREAEKKAYNESFREAKIKALKEKAVMDAKTRVNTSSPFSGFNLNKGFGDLLGATGFGSANNKVKNVYRIKRKPKSRTRTRIVYVKAKQQPKRDGLQEAMNWNPFK